MSKTVLGSSRFASIFVASIAAAFTVGLGPPARSAWAEGSDQMGPLIFGGSSIAAVNCTVGLGICQGLFSQTLLRVDIVNDRERFVWTGLGNVIVTSPTGEAVNGPDGDNLYASGEIIAPLAGVIGPYRLRPVENQFQCTDRPATSFCSTGNQIHTFHRWDVTVYDGTVPRPGRLWSLSWLFNARNFTATQATTASFFALMPGGLPSTDAIVEMRVDGLAGFIYGVSANRQGPQTVDLLSSGRSVPQLEGVLVPEYPLYLNVPEIARYGRVTESGIGVSNSQCSAAPGGAGGALLRTFTFNSNVPGTFQIICDLDAPPDGASLIDDDDLVLIGPATAGTNTVPWNGLDARGNVVPAGSRICRIRITVGEFHYVATDIETAFPGLRMFEVEATQDRLPMRMWWNDTMVQSGGARLANGETSPASSPVDGLLSASGAAVPFSLENPNGNARAWGEFDPGGISKGNLALLDTFVWLAAAEQAMTCSDAPADETPPLITPVVVGTLGNDGWYVSDVSVSWTVLDDESPVESSSGCDTVVLTSDTSGTTYTCTASSAGGTASGSVSIKRDATAPAILGSRTPDPNSHGWNNTDVTVTFLCSDVMSGVGSCGPTPDVVTTEGAEQSRTGTAIDRAGNTASLTIGGINIDKAPPIVTVQYSHPPDANGRIDSGGEPVAVTWTGADALSGVQSCSPAVVLTSAGVYELAGSCTDRAGNAATVTVTVQIVASVVTVSIDIKPGSFPNSINLGSGGSVPVAIFSSPQFDARTVDPLTVTLSGASVRLRGKGSPMAALEDVNGDGRMDLVVHVATDALQLSNGDTIAILEGLTFDRTPFRGTDSVRIVQ